MGESSFYERWEGTVKSIFGMNLSDYADGEQDTEKTESDGSAGWALV